MNGMRTVKQGIMFGMGNPLLDISAEVPTDYVEKYGLKKDNAILAEPQHLPIYEEVVANYEVEYIAGGATQNSVRVAQWMLGPKVNEFCCSYFGCIGDDKFGKVLEKNATEDGVYTSYLVDKEHPTGTCACLITGKSRSLIANLGAANHYKMEHLHRPEQWARVEMAEYYYISGFFLTVSPDAMLEVAKYAASKDRPFMTNLSAPFISQFFKEPQMRIMPYVDILFGNETEAEMFSKEQGFDTTDHKEIALRAAALPKETAKPRVVIITQGKDPVLMARDGKVEQFPVPAISPDDIIDTNGAGDAFVGGFLSQIVQGLPLERCIAAGIYAATTIIQQSGCTFPTEPSFK